MPAPATNDLARIGIRVRGSTADSLNNRAKSICSCRELYSTSLGFIQLARHMLEV